MTGERSPRYEGWRVVLASSSGVFVGFGSLVVYTFGIFLKPLAEEFSWSREGISAAFGFAAMMIAVASPLLGYLFDRNRPQRVILPALNRAPSGRLRLVGAARSAFLPVRRC